MNAVQWFRETFPHVLGWHTPNGEKRDRRTAEKLKRMGVLPGVADWLMFPDGVKIAIEFKRPDGGEQSDDQVKFEKAWKRNGGVYHVADDLRHFKSLCARYCGIVVPWA